MSALLAMLLGSALQIPTSEARDLPVLRPGDVVAGRIEDGDPVVATDTLRANYTDGPVVGRGFRIEVTESGPYHVDLRSDFFDAYLVLRDEQGRVLAEDDDGLIGTQSQIVLQAQPGAALRLEASALHGGRGAFEVSLVAGAPAVLDGQQRRQAEIKDLRRIVDVRTQALGPEHLDVATGQTNLARLLRAQGDYAAARSLCERSLAIREKALGPEHPDVAESLNNLAVLLREQGNYTGARPLYERSLAIREKALGPEHADVAEGLNNLAVLLRVQGNYAEARPLYERSLAIREKALGPEHLYVAESLNNLAVLLAAQGDYAGARPLHERSLAIREKVLGPEHPDVAQGLNNLALLLRSQGDYAGARPLFERSLAIQEKALGPEHPDVAEGLNNLAILLHAQGDYAGARPLYERSLAIREKTLGPEHPDVATGLGNLAVLLKVQGDYSGARPLYERSLAIREKALGSEHEDVASSLSNLASLLQAQGDYSGARPLYERSLGIREKALGPEHHDVATSLSNLAAVLQAQGDYAGARPLYERSLAIREKVLGPEHADVAAGLNNLASLLMDQGDYTGARPLYERSLAIKEQVLGPEHLDVATSLNNLAFLLDEQGDYAGARPLYERSLAIREKTLGPEHPAVATGLNNLAAVLLAQGDYPGTRPLLERSLAIREKVLGPEHPDVAQGLNNLAAELGAQGDYAGARPLLERAQAIYERTLGPEHPRAAAALCSLAVVLQAQGDYAGARRLLERALATHEKALGPEHPGTNATRYCLGMLLADLGQSEAATNLLAQGDVSRRLSLAHFLQRASEAEACDYLAKVRREMDLVQSPCTFFGPTTAAYESLLWWKGQVLRAARIGRAALRGKLDDAGRNAADRLHDVVAELSRSSSEIARSGELAGQPVGSPMDSMRLASLVDERGRLERQLNALTAGLVPEVPSWDKLRDALPENAALVDVFVHPVYEAARWDGTTLVAPGRWADPRVTAWVTRRDADAPVRVDLGPVAAIEAAIRAALQRVTGGRGASVAAPIDSAGTLRQQIWDPLALHLDGMATVVVSPDGVLGTVPFEILKGEDGRYLLEDRSFVYLTDPTEIARMSGGTPTTSGALLAIGGVDYGKAADVVAEANASTTLLASATHSDAAVPAPPTTVPRGGWTDVWAPLEATRNEARGVAARHEAVFPGSEDFVLTGPTASEEQLKALLPKYGLLHIATHGYFNPEGLASLDEAAQREVDRGRDSPGLTEESFTDIARRLQGYSPGLLSGLVCAGVNSDLSSAQEDGYLTAEEVGWLDLSGVNLVVLSACDTGLGRPQSGEGMIGLRRAFLLAGAKTVISSLWSVPDQETADLMDLFYGNLWQQKLGKHAALRAAQLTMIARNRERYDGDARPVSWGAFVLDGDWR